MGIALIRNRGSRAAALVGTVAAVTAMTALGVGAAGAAGPRATASHTLQLSDNANLRENNHKGIELKESGSAHGNLPGSIYIQLKTYPHSVTAMIQLYQNKTDRIYANASAGYRIVSASTATFSGSLNITGGTGRYAKARGSKLSFSGSVHRPGNAVTVHVSGRMSY